MRCLRSLTVPCILLLLALGAVAGPTAMATGEPTGHEDARTTTSEPTDPTSVGISPSGPYTSDDLHAVAGGSTDPNGRPFTYEYQWAKSDDGGASWGAWGNNGQTLASANTTGGDVWKARARADNGSAYSGYTESAPVTIGNTAPTAPTSVNVAPSSPVTTDDITASASGSTDADGDSITYEYQWAKTIDGGSTGGPTWGYDGPTLDSSNTGKDDSWKARGRAYDGTDYSGWTESGEVTIGNAAPTAPTGVDISPTSPVTADSLTASASGSTDADGDSVSHEYQWARISEGGSGTSVTWGHDGPTLDSSNTNKGDVWKARGRAYDGTDYSGWTESGEVTIGNTAPTAPTSVDVSPTAPVTTDNLTASGTGSTDADGDSVSYEYQWAKISDGGSFVGPTWGNDGPTLDSSNTAKGETWKARGRAYDGTDYSAWTESGPVTVGDSTPTLAWVGTTGYLTDGVDPGSGGPDATAFTFAVKYTDPDGDAPTKRAVRIQRLQDGRDWLLHTALDAQPGTGDWATGRICSATTTLPNGVYQYRFYFEDGSGAAVTGEPAAWTRGPGLDASPQLWCTTLVGRTDDFVHPNAGTAWDTKFKFSVQYTDGEGNAPTVRRVDIQTKRRDGQWTGYCSGIMAAWAGTPRTGKLYTFQRKLPAGEYRFKMVYGDEDGPATASDSVVGDCTQWQAGPTVTDGSADASAVGAAVTSLSAVPTRAGAQVTFRLTSSAGVDARILNVAGRPVATLCDSKALEAGTNTLLWSACTDAGLPVPAGTYLVSVVARSPDGATGQALVPLQLRR